jgi:acetyl esterase/lipase
MKAAGALLGIATLLIAAWIYIPAPTYFLLTFGVGAPEISHWLIVGSVIGIAMSIRLRSRWILACNALALLLSLSIWVRAPGTIKRFEYAMRGYSVTPASPLRKHPIQLGDLFSGIDVGNARITRDVRFKDSLTVDIYQPTRTGTFPILVQIYGGAWQRGKPADKANFATWLASSGYVVMAIDYRHAPAYKWPAQIDDVNDALTWVAQHAAEYGGDTSRVVLMGRSAGAHLATYAAWFTSPIHLRGVVSYYGPADLAEAYRHPPRPDPLHIKSVEEALLGGTLEQMPQRYFDASTITHLPTLGHPTPPSLLIYGGRDHIVEARYGAKLVAALSGTGGKVVYLEIPWAEHAFDEVFNGPSSQLALYYTERFLAWSVK